MVKDFNSKMSTKQDQLEKSYKCIEPENMIHGQKYLLAFSNYYLMGKLTNMYAKQWSKVTYAEIKNKNVQISHNGYKVFSLQDIRKRQALLYFKDIFPYEIILIIGEKWAEL